MLGFEREIKHLDGHTVDLTQNTPTQPYQVFKIQNEGMPYKDDPTQFGHLFVKAEVVFPNRFTEDQKKLIGQIFKEKTYKEEL
jgi:DnaJ-related protein SCJ1